MVDDSKIVAGAAAYRGFLFSDIRGFTAFAERHGNAAAAAAVARFLDVARTAIARHEGAEVKTEGDAIHAVFPSASSAVLCGLEIQDGAAELNANEPDRPLGLGVGVHAGEAIETAEGYIGRAVNIAARLCSEAKPGEVLVSSTVKGITQASIQVGFIPKGSRRLKGIQDPILVYAVTRDLNAKAPRTVPRPVVLGAGGVAALAVLAIAVIAGSQLLGVPGGSPGASSGATSGATLGPASTTGPAVQPVVIGPLLIGTYRTRAFQPRLTFDVVDLGWNANREVAEILGLVRDTAPRGSMFFLRVAQVVESPCVTGGEAAGTAPSAADLLATVRRLTHLTLSDSTTVRVGGFVGQQVDITVSEGALAACGGLAGGDVALFVAGGEEWKALPGERFRLISLDVSNQAVTILISTDWTQTPSVQEHENLNEVAHDLLDTVRF